MFPTHIILSPQNVLPLCVKRKRGHYLRLSLSRQGGIKLSVPYITSEKTAIDFIESKKDWIKKHLDRIEIRKELIKEDLLINGGGIKILDANYKVNIEHSLIEDIIVCGGGITIFSKNPQNEEYVKRQYQNYFKQKAQEYFKTSFEKFYPVFEKCGCKRPLLKFKTLKSMWGNCNWKKNIIVLNYNLFKTSQCCIDYVVLHELTHLLYRSHNRDFYGFIENYMPLWKKYKKMLSGCK